MNQREELARSLVDRQEELEAELADPALYEDPHRYRAVVREHAALEPAVTAIHAYRELEARLEETRSLLAETAELGDEPELEALLQDELAQLEAERDSALVDLDEKLIPPDPSDLRDVVLEIRAAAGGDESALFARDLWEMYSRYCERRGFEIDLVEVNESELGGLRELVAVISGQAVYGRLRFESGAHRVQRVPRTESQGRIHTSTATVAVLPEVDEVELEIDPSDLRVDTYRASGAGGQHVNKTSSAIRITHLPTGIVVTCQDERSQHRNRDKAMAVLRARLLEREESRRDAALASERRSLVGTGDRSERIRTYNVGQNRVTDHRIGLTLYRLDQVLAGDLDLVIDPLIRAARGEELRQDMIPDLDDDDAEL
ncbi:MAG: peptide chain release factor 1 [Bacillota bacterium]|nr:peptide chain release factor 1 [Bacillota bacterium]